MKSRFFLPILAVLLTAAVSFGINALAGTAFTEPSGPPTSYNANAPLDTSATAQTKSGNLSSNAFSVDTSDSATGAIFTAGGALFNTSNTTNGLIVYSGNVGIDTTTTPPAYALDVAGKIHSSSGFIFPDGSIQTTAFIAP
jgi:hypothetical protein